MAKEKVVEGVKNLKSQKYFILVDENISEGKIRVINPNGDLLDLSQDIFDDYPKSFSENEVLEVFTPEQLSSYERYLERARQDLEISSKQKSEESQVRTNHATQTSSPAPLSSEQKKPSLHSRKKSSPLSKDKGTIKQSWIGKNMIFYRHKIEPLRLTDLFSITIEGEGEYVFLKEEFLRIFNDVIMSSSYRREGYFSFTKTPERAARFLKK